MTKVVFGNHASAFVPRQDRTGIRKLYGEVLGGVISHEEEKKDLFCLGGNFHIAFIYGDYADERKFLRSGRSVWLEIKSDNVEETARKILESGVVEKLDIPDTHLYFQAPGGQCMRLVGIDEDLSKYEGVGEGLKVKTSKEAVGRLVARTPSSWRTTPSSRSSAWAVT